MRISWINARSGLACACLAGASIALQVEGCSLPTLFDVPTDIQSFFQTLLTFATDVLRQVLAAWLF